MPARCAGTIEPSGRRMMKLFPLGSQANAPLPASQIVATTVSLRSAAVGLNTTNGHGPSTTCDAEDRAPSAVPRPGPPPKPMVSTDGAALPGSVAAANDVSIAAASARYDCVLTILVAAAAFWNRPIWYWRVARTPEPGRMSWNCPNNVSIHASRMAAEGYSRPSMRQASDAADSASTP